MRGSRDEHVPGTVLKAKAQTEVILDERADLNVRRNRMTHDAMNCMSFGWIIGRRSTLLANGHVDLGTLAADALVRQPLWIVFPDGRLHLVGASSVVKPLKRGEATERAKLARCPTTIGFSHLRCAEQSLR